MTAPQWLRDAAAGESRRDLITEWIVGPLLFVVLLVGVVLMASLR